MIRVSLVTIVAMLFFALACGKDPAITVGGNNGDDSNADNANNAREPNSSTPTDAGNNDRNSEVADAANPELDASAVDMATPPDAGSTADMTGPDMTEPDMSADMADAACPSQNIAYGQPCDCDNACLSGLCLDDTATTPGTCSRTCTSRQDCRIGADACVLDEELQQQVCRPDDTGTSCDSDGPTPSLCSVGICLRGGSNYSPAHFCSVGCLTAADCKMGHSCSPVRCQETSSGEFSCIPTVVASRAGDAKPQILAAYPIDSNLCMPVGETNPCDLASDQFACPSGLCDAQADRCTGQCEDTQDCPAGGCEDINVSDPDLPIRGCRF